MTPTVGDLVLIPFPFTDLSGRKKRPALVVTAPDAAGDFHALAVTSKDYHADGIMIEASDLSTGRLPVTSWIRPDKVFTLHESLVLATVGRLASDKLAFALSDLCGHLGCTA